MTSIQIRKKFLKFFAERRHQLVASSSLIPADPTALFTSAGMQQFEPYLGGQANPPYRRAMSIQKCFRTSDIDNIGDKFHHTFFEMLGNWSFGDYFKEKAIKYAYEFLISELKIPKSKLWVTVFKGNKNIPKDEEAINIWRKYGITRDRIKEFGMEDNFWGPITQAGPCGPCSEIFIDRGKEFSSKRCTIKGCGPNCKCGRFVEIWNLVFMQYKKTDKGYEPLPNKNIDTGMGLERITAIIEGKKSDYETELFLPIIEKIEEKAKIPYNKYQKAYHIIADHIRGACFLIADGVLPQKEDKGYVLRRILRRALRYSKEITTEKTLLDLVDIVINIYKDIYPELSLKRNNILTVIDNEKERFDKTLLQGLKKVKKVIKNTLVAKRQIIDAKDVFHLYDTYGFPVDLTKEIARESNLEIDEKGFQDEFIRHQKISKIGARKKFGGHGIMTIKNKDERLKVIKLHTATHLLQAALREVLGPHVHQSGSDINPERLRFDFTNPKALTKEEINKVEKIVNQKIKENLSIKMVEMPYDEAIKIGALAFFKEKYPKIVKVYSIGNFSKEICAGPHVQNTGQLGRFKIIKEKSSGAGLRRIKAILK